VVALVRAGRPEAVLMVREAGRVLGDVLAGGVNFFNPSVIAAGRRDAFGGEPQRERPAARDRLEAAAVPTAADGVAVAADADMADVARRARRAAVYRCS
jgi:predicted NBD/HSP70 family sugar kinase